MNAEQSLSQPREDRETMFICLLPLQWVSIGTNCRFSEEDFHLILWAPVIIPLPRSVTMKKFNGSVLSRPLGSGLLLLLWVNRSEVLKAFTAAQSSDAGARCFIRRPYTTGYTKGTET